jgi:hypothetical protein
MFESHYSNVTHTNALIWTDLRLQSRERHPGVVRGVTTNVLLLPDAGKDRPGIFDKSEVRQPAPDTSTCRHRHVVTYLSRHTCLPEDGGTGDGVIFQVHTAAEPECG